MRVVVMGVSGNVLKINVIKNSFSYVKGCGKTSVGQAVANEFSIPFFDADDFHSQENKQKMGSGTSLTDEDR